MAEGFNDPFASHLNRLQYTLRGIKRSEAEKGGKNRERLPVGPTVVWLDTSCHIYDKKYHLLKFYVNPSKFLLHYVTN